MSLQVQPLDPSLAAPAGEPDDVANLFPLVYEELRRLAHGHLRREATGHTLSTTDLVHQAYVQLSAQTHARWTGRTHFVSVAATAMRRILIDYARAHRSVKRGGTLRRVPLEAVGLPAEDRAELLLALDEALDRLTAVNERYGRVVECRFFGGLSVEETAEALGTSPATVKRDWTMARAWLNRELAT
jgi:RNA polymerase sigma factor (TIGR02999 family)